MNNEYIIINKTALQKRIEELEKMLAYYKEWYEKARESYRQERKEFGQADDGEMRTASDAAMTATNEIKILKEILSQSTPLIPEIEKAFESGVDSLQDELIQKLGLRYQISEVSSTTITSTRGNLQDYISNLKLDI